MDTTLLDHAKSTLRERRAERERLESRLATLAEEVDQLENFIQVWERLSPTAAVTEPPPSGPLADPDLELKDAAVYAFKKVTKVMRSRELAERLLSMGFPYDKGVEALDASLRGILSRNTDADGGPFTKFDRGVYGLASWTRAQRVLAGAEKAPPMEGNETTPGPAATDPGAAFGREG